jgi:hypothetical protein
MFILYNFCVFSVGLSLALRMFALTLPAYSVDSRAAPYAAHWRERLAVSVRFDRREDWSRISGPDAGLGGRR